MSYEIMGRFVPTPPPLRIKPGEIRFLRFDEMKITDHRDNRVNRIKQEVAPPAESDQTLFRIFHELRRWLTLPFSLGLVEWGFWLVMHVNNRDASEETKIFLAVNFMLLMAAGGFLIPCYFVGNWFLGYGKKPPSDL